MSNRQWGTNGLEQQSNPSQMVKFTFHRVTKVFVKESKEKKQMTAQIVLEFEESKPVWRISAVHIAFKNNFE